MNELQNAQHFIAKLSMVELPTASLLQTIACNKHWDTYENDLYSSSSQGHDIFTLRSFLFSLLYTFPGGRGTSPSLDKRLWRKD